MSENKHTPEPWFWSEKHGEICFTSMYDDQSYGMSCPVDMEDESNSGRIIACVNACAGIPTIWLESGTTGCLQNVRTERNDYQKQRDELLAALEKMNRAYVNLIENGRDRIIDLGGKCDPLDVMERSDPNLKESRAVIASVKGSAA